MWASEYGSEFSSARLQHETWMDRSHPFYDCPRGVQHGLYFCEPGRSVLFRCVLMYQIYDTTPDVM